MPTHLLSDFQQENLFKAHPTPMVELNIKLVNSKLSQGMSHTYRLIIRIIMLVVVDTNNL